MNLGLKKLDNLVIQSFLPPFVATFFIALFVLVMQTLWLYIDDIAGKGVGFFLLVELVGYMSVSMIPMALPVAVLISSVMVLGGLAERYELSSIKSAGISLWRTMRPLMFVTLMIGVFSFFCSNYFIPVSNLKFKSRLHDIKHQKPALSLEESVFNDDFHGYSIRINDKLPDNKTIREVLLYDNRDGSKDQINLVAADSGQMYGSADGKYFVMQLFDGSQVSEPTPTNKNGTRNYPMVRSTFREWTKVFNLNEFDLDRTPEELFKSHHTMLSNRQLLIAIDSIDRTVAERIGRYDEQTDRFFHFFEKKSFERKKLEREEDAKKKKEERKIASDSTTVPPDSNAQTGRQDPLENLALQEKLKNQSKPNPQKPTRPNLKNTKPGKAIDPQRDRQPPVTRPEPGIGDGPTTLTAFSDPINQQLDKPISEYTSIAETFRTEKRFELLDKAVASAKSVLDQATSTLKSSERTLETRVKHVFEYHSKYSLAVACFIFLFVGAPMGAIVRKGGFGMPLLISIIFFMLFIIISIFSKNIAERFVIHATLAGWMNCLVIFPMGLVLTYWAMRDMGWTQIAEMFTLEFWRNR